MSEQTTLPAVAAHGARRLPSVDVDSYNVELKDSEGFIGDRASKGAFRNMIDRIRKSMRKAGDDPLGDEDSDELTKAELDELLLRGEPEAAGLVHAAIEDFSQEFALIIQRFLKLKEWKDTERIAVGGGFRASRVGELVTGRTTVILKGEKIADRTRADPQPPGRSGPDRRGPSRSRMDVPRFRRPSGGGHRRNQHSCRSCTAQPQASAQSLKGQGVEILAVAAW